MADGHGRGWERLASREGGTVTALTTAPGTDDSDAVFAATAVGLYRSGDGGRRWESVGTGDIIPLVEAIAASPDFARDGVIFAGTRDGLFRSSDGGEHWELALGGDRIPAVVAATGDLGERVVLAGTATDGLFRSTDGGHRWASANAGLLDLTVLALALSPGFVRDQTGFAGTVSGLYRTRSGGKSWRALDLPLGEPAVQALAVSPTFADNGLVLAGTEADGLWRSDDGGARWAAVPALVGGSVAAIAISARGTIAAATSAGIAIAPAGDGSWRVTGTELGPVLSLQFVADGAGEILLAGLVRRGVARSTDGGATWQRANEGLRARLLPDLALSPAFATERTIVAAGLEDGALLSTDGGATWSPRNAGLGDAAVLRVAFSPRYPADQTLYAATGAGLYRSRDGAASWQSVGAAEASGPIDTFAVGSAGDGSGSILALATAGRLLLSRDEGVSWQSRGEALRGARVLSLALSPNYEHDRTLFAATTAHAPDTGSAVVALWRSVDGGARWEPWLEEQVHRPLPLALAPGHGPDGTVYVGLGGRVLTPRHNAWETRDGRRRPLWRGVRLAGEGVVVTALAATSNHRHEATLFAATNRGVYRSCDAGRTFAPWGEDDMPGPVVALAVSPNHPIDRLVFAVGLDGTIWRREDR